MLTKLMNSSKNLSTSKSAGDLSHSQCRLPWALCSRLAVRQLSVTCQRCTGKKQASDEGPIPFSSSKAASWSMTKSVVLPARDVPWYQPLSICLSVSAFLIYFLVLREENDLDIELNYTLFERLPQLEEHQVKVALDYYRQQGKDTRELEERLAEIQRNKAQVSQETS